MKTSEDNQDMLEEYDFSGAVRGKYAEKYKSGTNVILLDEEVLKYFPDSASVNDALKKLTKIFQNVKSVSELDK